MKYLASTITLALSLSTTAALAAAPIGKATAAPSPTPASSPTPSPTAPATAADTPAAGPGKGSPEFEDFGGVAGLTSLVDTFASKLVAEPRMTKFFAKIDQKRFKSKLVEQFCVVLEGPCTYTGQSMADSHDGLGIRHSDFNGLVEVLRASMKDHKIPMRAQNKLLAKLAPMHKDIIGK